MKAITPIDKWQLKRLDVLADMLATIVDAYSTASAENAAHNCAPIISRLDEFHEFSRLASEGKLEDGSKTTSDWTTILENAETDIIRSMFAEMGNDAIEILHRTCREQGRKWGGLVSEKKVNIDHDARKALLILNDFLIDGNADDDNIEIRSSGPQQVTYVTHHCDFIDRFRQSQEMAWALCSSRQAWKDGFFEVLGGVAHQNITSKCNGDDCCMRIITVTND